MDLGTALTAYTAGSAYVNHLDDTGTIRRGALADFAVLDRDPFAGPPDQIAATRAADVRRRPPVYAADDA
ncbi:MAG: amidohydrolase family protein [Nocardioides sp.]